jgi:hypothetical protein
MQTLGADAALYATVLEIWRNDDQLQSLCPGGLHFLRVPPNVSLPAVAFKISEADRCRTFGMIASTLLVLTMKVITPADLANAQPFKGEAARARLRYHFDGTKPGNSDRIKAVMEPLLTQWGWHLQRCYEETAIAPNLEPVATDLTTLRHAVGAVFYVPVQPTG